MFHVKHNIMNRLERIKKEKEFEKSAKCPFSKGQIDFVQSLYNQRVIVDPEVHAVFVYDIKNGLTLLKK